MNLQKILFDIEKCDIIKLIDKHGKEGLIWMKQSGDLALLEI